MRLIIVGAGIAGACLSRAAQSAGLDTLVIANDQGGSVAALGIVRPSYLIEEERKLIAPSLADFERLGTPIVKGARVTSYLNDTVKRQADWWAVAPVQPLIKPDVLGIAAAVSEDAVEVDGVKYSGRIVWCDGKGPGRATFGSTFVNPNPAAVAHEFAVHHVAPYKTVCCTQLAGEARVGSSSAATPDKGILQGEGLFEKARTLGWITQEAGWVRLDGRRLQRSPYLDRSGPHGTWRWSGFHRSGYSLAPALASKVLSQVTA